MTLTEKIIKEFEEKFDATVPLKVGTTNAWDKREKNCSHDLTEYKKEAKKELKSFLLSSLHQIATEAIEAVRLETKIRDINKGGGQYGHPETDFDTGYNEAILDTEQKAKKFLEDNF